MVDEKKDSIIEKIRKLFALAGNNPSEEERNRASEAAQKLMDAHNLTQHDIHSGGQAVTSKLTAITAEGWTREVCKAVSLLYHTKYYRDNTSGKWKAAFVGTPINIEVSESIALWLMESIKRESADTFELAADQRDFCNGAALRIAERARKIADEQKKPAPATGGAQQAQQQAAQNQLMVMRNSLQLANEAFIKANLNLQNSRRTSYTATGAFTAGTKFGDNASLNRQVHGTGTKRIGG